MPLRITFDTNTLDLACRPDRYHKDSRQPHLAKVRDALANGSIEGFYSVTLLTIEAVMRTDRARVLAGTQISSCSTEPELIKNADLPDEMRDIADGRDIVSFTTRLTVEQPDRRPVPEEFAKRVKAAKDLGVRALKQVPRIGAFSIDDPTGEYYLSNGDGEELGQWISKAHEVCASIENRGCGRAQVNALGLKMADASQVWYQGLKNAKDIHEERAIERSFSEWADGDAIASHIAYGIDVFCTDDVGNSNANKSVLDAGNRAWLTATYGVRFMSFDELLASLP